MNRTVVLLSIENGRNLYLANGKNKIISNCNMEVEFLNEQGNWVKSFQTRVPIYYPISLIRNVPYFENGGLKMRLLHCDGYDAVFHTMTLKKNELQPIAKFDSFQLLKVREREVIQSFVEEPRLENRILYPQEPLNTFVWMDYSYMLWIIAGLILALLLSLNRLRNQKEVIDEFTDTSSQKVLDTSSQRVPESKEETKSNVDNWYSQMKVRSKRKSASDEEDEKDMLRSSTFDEMEESEIVSFNTTDVGTTATNLFNYSEPIISHEVAYPAS